MSDIVERFIRGECTWEEALTDGSVYEELVRERGGHTVRCDYASCHYAVHTGSAERAQAAYAEHLRTDARHTGGEWIDRDGRARKGLEEP